ncbi:MAG: acyl-CoA dehydrogenase family protein [Synergistaceae bacterium]|jgi:alkylation response protein AidB-like acyl-CoA dehydrogenase|nr:acyl-CoA dehydrogenase family protein [Synergistaceae bacterium]
MLIELTEGQRIAQKTAREFAAEVAPHNREMDLNGFSQTLHDRMMETGLPGVLLPAEYGGLGGDALSAVIVLYELAKGSASVALSLDANWLGVEAILRHGSDEQKKKYLPMSAGKGYFAFALTEPGAGSDAAAVSAEAKKTADGYVLDGVKSWCTNGGLAGVYIVMARTDCEGGRKGANGISAFIVERANPGLAIGLDEDKMGMRGSRTTNLLLKNCNVGKEALLGKEGGGFKIAMGALDGARVCIAAMGAGITEAALDVSREFANRREAFGAPIANIQAIQFKIAEMAIGLEAAKLLTLEAARKRASGERHTKEAAMAKFFSSSHAVKSAMEAIQIHGARGYSKDVLPELLLRDAKMLEIGEGANEVLLMLIGRAELSGK